MNCSDLLNEFDTYKNLLSKYDNSFSFTDKIEIEEQLKKKQQLVQPVRIQPYMYINYTDSYNGKNETEQAYKDNIFSLTSNQHFLKKFLSFDSINRGMLLFHGVGVGKTCSAIQIAENFIDIFTKKILVLLPSKLENNFRKELFNVNKIKNNKIVNSCIEHRINKELLLSSTSKKDLVKQGDIFISENYEFIGYAKLSRQIKTLKLKISTYTKNVDKQKILYFNKLRDMFSDRVIILDEVHHIKSPDNEKITKDLTDILHDIMYCSKNVRLVLLSATPMFDDPSEIKIIMDLLMKNDNIYKKNIKNLSLFKNQNSNELTPEFEKMLVYFSKNYVSYMRGENPYTFPLRLYPSYIKNDSYISNKILQPNEYPKYDVYSEKIPEDQQIKFLELIKSEASSLQRMHMKNMNYGEKLSINNDFQKNNTKRIQLSNICYPPVIENDTNMIIGITGINTHFTDTSSISRMKLKYKPGTVKKYDYFLHPDNIQKYSPKIKSILDSILTSTGIVLVYTQFIASGVLPLCMALEHAGYDKYDKKNILYDMTSENKTKHKKSTYITITGDSRLSINLNKEIEVLQSKENKHGGLIKVVIITDKGTEGLDLKNIREIHVMEPWYNNNKLEQIYGRGIRKLSHINLDEEYRNVTIFNHVNIFDKDTENVDFRNYRLSETKQNRISKIERVMKINAIDCRFNKKQLFFKTNETRKIVTSKNIEIANFPIRDKSKSRVCDYLEECDFVCSNEENIDDILKHITLSNIDIDILDYEIDNCVQHIVKHYDNENLFTKPYDTLESHLSSLKFPKFIIKLAIHRMITNKSIFTLDSKSGFFIMRNDIFIFHPHSIKDTKISQSSRDFILNNDKKLNKTQYIVLKNMIPEQRSIEKKSAKITPILQRINNMIMINNTMLLFYIKPNNVEVHKRILFDMVIDLLKPIHFLQLINQYVFTDKEYNNKKYIIESLLDGNYIMKDEKNDEIKHYFSLHEHSENHNDNKVVRIYTSNDHSKFERAKESFIKQYIDNIKKSISLVQKGFYKLKKSDTEFKIDTKEIKFDNLDDMIKYLQRKGTVCEKTSTLNIPTMIELIKNTLSNIDDVKPTSFLMEYIKHSKDFKKSDVYKNKTTLLKKSIEDNSDFLEKDVYDSILIELDTDKNKYSDITKKNMLCLLFEYLIRYEKMLMRPATYKLITT